MTERLTLLCKIQLCKIDNQCGRSVMTWREGVRRQVGGKVQDGGDTRVPTADSY